MFKEVFSYPVQRADESHGMQKLKEGQRFLDKGEVIRDVNGRPITPKHSSRASSKHGSPKKPDKKKLVQRESQDYEPAKPTVIVNDKMIKKKASINSSNNTDRYEENLRKNSTISITGSQMQEETEESNDQAYMPPET